MLRVGLEVAVAEQQRHVGINAGGGDDPVDRLARCDAPAAQCSVILCRLSGVAAAEHW
jgi:hypothetical protein